MDSQVLVASRRALLRAVVASMFVVTSAMPVIAQVSALSSIRGTVSDATGAALPGVTVTLTSPALQVAEMAAAVHSAEDSAAVSEEVAADAEGGAAEGSEDISMDDVLGAGTRKRPVAATEDVDTQVESKTF